MPDTIKLPRIQYRSVVLDRDGVDAERRTVELSFSSEEPVDRFFGTEILGHRKGEVDLSRLRARGPLLVDHRTSEHIGVIEKASVGSDRMGRAVVRFGKGTRADEVFEDVLDGIRSHVSVGYRVHEMQLVESKKDGDVFRVTRWEPLEISIVSVPADPSVGVGRGDDAQTHQVRILQPEEATMPNKPDPSERDNNPAPDPTPSPAPAAAPTVPPIDENKIRGDVLKEEQARVREITAIGKQFRALGISEDMVNAAIDGGTAVEEFRKTVMDELAKRGAQVVNLREPQAQLGLSDREVRQYSVLRAIRSIAFPNERRYVEDAAFERECSNAVAELRDAPAQGIYIPDDVIQRGQIEMAVEEARRFGMHTRALELARDLQVGGEGGELVATNLLAGSMIDLLRNRMVTQRLGAQVLDGLVGNVAIPRQTGAATFGWIASEGGAASESTQTLDQVTMSPKDGGAFTDYTRRLLLQSSISVENFVRADLMAIAALGIDLGALYGSGAAGQPTGVANTVGIGSVTFPTAGPTWADIVQLETEVAADNADMGTLAYLTDATLRGTLKTTEKAASTAQFIWEPGNTVNGYRTEVSNQVTDGDMFFGNWADLLIGRWGGFDILVDPFTASTTGTIRIVLLVSVDVAVRHAESFSLGN